MLAGDHALRRCQLDHLLGGEAVRAHDRFGTALLRAGRQPFERAAAVVAGGPWRRWQSGAGAEAVSASMPEYTQTRGRMRRPQARRTRASVLSARASMTHLSAAAFLA